MLTEQGQVIGLVVFGINAEGAENLNFALPINYVRGQLSLAANRTLRSLVDVQEPIVVAGGGSATGGSSTGGVTAPSTGDAYYGDVNLDERFSPDPHEFSLTAGGTVDLGDGECDFGYVAQAPDVNFYYASLLRSNIPTACIIFSSRCYWIRATNSTLPVLSGPT